MGSNQQSEEMSRVAEAFVAARREGHALPEYPGSVPLNLADAYRIQDAAVGLCDAPIGGWKVGRINPPIDRVDRLAGPIFAEAIVGGVRALPSMRVFSDGFGAAEAEFLLRIGKAPDPSKADFTIDEAVAMIDAVHVGIEVASSPFPGINDFGPAVTISDFGNNNGLVVGALIPDWHERAFEQWPVELRINGNTVGRGRATNMLDGPFGAARFLFELMAARGIALQTGQWISSGAVTGVHRVARGDHVEALFDDALVVECNITSA